MSQGTKEQETSVTPEPDICVICNKKFLKNKEKGEGLLVCDVCERSFQKAVKANTFDDFELLHGSNKEVKFNTDPEYREVLVVFLGELEITFKKCTQPITEDSKLFWAIWSRKFNITWKDTEEEVPEFTGGFPALNHLFFLWQSRARLFTLLDTPKLLRPLKKIRAERKYYKALRQYLFGRFGL